MARHFIGWEVDREDRRRLLARFPARYSDAVADHVTLKFAPDTIKLPTERSGEIVGEADDGEGVQAMVVQIGGTTDRPDGSTYHITWSLGSHRKARESNDVLRDKGWEPLPAPIDVTLEPARF